MLLGGGMRLKMHCQVNMKKETQINKIRDKKGKIPIILKNYDASL